jgi:putative ATP-binding cassette transporter
MTLLDIVRQEGSVNWRRLLVVAVLAGVSNAMVLAILNSAAQAAARRELQLLAPVFLALVIAVYVWAQRRVMLASAKEVEAIVDRLRLSMVQKIRQAELRPIERLGAADIYASISSETTMISQAANMVVLGCQAGILIVCTMVYVGILSLPALILSGAGIALASLLHLRRIDGLNRKFGEAISADARLFDGVDDVVSGAKEIRLNSHRRAAIERHVDALSQASASTHIDLQERIGKEFVFTQTLFFLLLGAVVFMVPNFDPGHPETMMKVTTAMLFLVGSLSILLQAIPTFARANAAAAAIGELNARLESMLQGSTTPSSGDPPLDFTHLVLTGVCFEYEDIAGERGFRVGPVDLSIRRGEIVFIVGGNGSGKSTLLKLLTGLYRPRRGTITVDGRLVESIGSEPYRSVISTIFADFHLFRPLYGIEADPFQVNRLLSDFKLDGKASFADGAFSSIDLSTGQRKRLALIVAELEDRPILVMDEWAAEQDPEFREHFYRELLPALRARGKTIIAATHDDRYFDAADRVLRMEDGRLMPLADRQSA